MPLPVPTNIATGFADLSGCSRRSATDQLYVADDGAGQIVAVNPHSHVKTVLGTGYNFPHDIELSRGMACMPISRKAQGRCSWLFCPA